MDLSMLTDEQLMFMDRFLRQGVTDDLMDSSEVVPQIENTSITASGAMFSTWEQGFLPALMESMYESRKTYKNMMLQAKKQYELTPTPELLKEISRCHNMQLAKKIQLNSAYGSLANPYFRWFDPKLAESITMSGQLTIRWIERKLNEYLNDTLGTSGVDYVIASDTDSIYLHLDEFVQQNCRDMDAIQTTKWLDDYSTSVLAKVIEDNFVELARITNAYQQKMKMKREAIADKGIWTGKKRYILNVYNNEGVEYKEPQLKMVGIEAVRSSTPKVCRDAIKNAIKIVMTKNESDLIDFVEDFRKKFYVMPYEDVAFPRGVNGTVKYADSAMVYGKKCPIHVRGALLYNKLIDDMKLNNHLQKIKDGDKIKFCYLKVPNPLQDDVISTLGPLPKELGLDSFVDYQMQFEKTFIDPITKIVSYIGWSTEKRNNLMGFFE